MHFQHQIVAFARALGFNAAFGDWDSLFNWKKKGEGGRENRGEESMCVRTNNLHSTDVADISVCLVQHEADLTGQVHFDPWRLIAPSGSADKEKTTLTFSSQI